MGYIGPNSFHDVPGDGSNTVAEYARSIRGFHVHYVRDIDAVLIQRNGKGCFGESLTNPCRAFRRRSYTREVTEGFDNGEICLKGAVVVNKRRRELVVRRIVSRRALKKILSHDAYPN